MGKYYSVNYSSSDDAIDMTEIEDTLEHSIGSKELKLESCGFRSANEAQSYFGREKEGVNLYGIGDFYAQFRTPIESVMGGHHINIELEINSKNITNKSNGESKSISLPNLKTMVIRAVKQKLMNTEYTITDDVATKAATKMWIDRQNKMNKEASRKGYNNSPNVKHSAFNDQLASNDDKAKYYKYMSGKYDPKTKNVTLKFANGLYNIQVVCQGSMYGRVNSLPEMKEYVQNAFYAEVGAHKYLDSSNASKAAVYLWDAKNSHFGKANPMSRLQHSALQHSNNSGKARPYVFDRVIKSNDGKQLGVRFTGGGDRNWIEVYFPWLAPTDEEKYYINYLRNEFSGKLRERPEATRTVPGEIEKAAKAIIAYYSNPPKVRRRGSGLGTGPVGPGYMPNISHSFTVVPAYDEDYLEHHGILGMKWGVRRYQNEDGSLTDAGRKRYGQGDPNYQRKRGIKTSEEMAQTIHRLRNAGDIAKDVYKFQNSTGNEEEFKTGEAHAKATEHYAKYLSDSVKNYKDMLARHMPKDVSDKYISYMLQQEVKWLNQQSVDKGVRIIYSLDTSMGLDSADFKLDFMYPDQRKIK